VFDLAEGIAQQVRDRFGIDGVRASDRHRPSLRAQIVSSTAI
jgi:hypothetical protein